MVIEILSPMRETESHRGMSDRILIPNELHLSVRVPDGSTKFHQNQVKIATQTKTDATSDSQRKKTVMSVTVDFTLWEVSV